MFLTISIPRCIFVLIILNYINSQNVFVENENVCQFMVSNNIWEFQSSTRRIQFGVHEVFLNLCNKLIGISGCDNDAMVCIKKSGNIFIPNAGSNVRSDTENQYIAYGMKCEEGTYKTTLTFDIKQKQKESFQIDGCNVTISLNLEPNCSTNFERFILDLTPLSQINNITVDNGNISYHLGICNYSKMCGYPYSGCIMGTEEKFTNFATQKVVFDYRENKLFIKGKVGKKKFSKIFINCNWFVTVGKTEKLFKKYEFGVESKYGCVKLPTNCSVIKNDEYLYNISKLNRPAGWHIQVPDGKLRINVCGPLEYYEKTECSDIHSQVCLRNKEKYTSYGSIEKPLEVLEDALQLEILYGSKCVDDVSQLLRTKIKFLCNIAEKGPILIDTKKCIYDILWETPQACPKNIEVESIDFVKENLQQEVLDCKVGRFFDLNPLVSNTTNYEVKDNEGNIYYINLCRPLVLTNNTYSCKNRGACLKNVSDFNVETMYTGFGSAKVPKFDEAGPVLEYHGGWCGNSSQYNLVIRFRCLNEAKDVLVFNKKTNCRFEFFWYTPLLCKRTLVKCHKLFNFDKITASKIVINTSFLKYSFNLCDSEYTVSSLKTGNETVRNANVSITYSKCKYTLEYKLTDGTKCDPYILNAVYLTFECTETSTDYYEEESVDDCVLYMKFWTSQACNILENNSDVNCIKKVEKIILPAHHNCMINFVGGEQMNITSMAPLKVVSGNKNLYTIANETASCGDFICKNDVTIGSIVDVCPSFNIDILSKTVQMDFMGSTCGTGFFKATLLFRCRESQADLPKVISENTCNSTIEIPDILFCKLLQHDVNQEATINSGLLAAVIVLLIIITSSIIGSFVYLHRKKHYTAIDKSRIYLRNCNL